MRAAVWLVVGALLLATVAVAADEAAKPVAPVPDGSIELTSGSAALVVGYRWGDGRLTFQGKSYPFSVTGIEVGEVGGSEAKAAGDVYDLKKLEDFNGTYSSASANLTLGKGGGGWHLVNEKGVHLELKRSTVGLKLTAGFDGMKLTLK